MSDIFIGARVQNLDIGEAVQNISRVNVAVDSDNMYTAGDDTGRTVEVECPFGSQAMADSLLSKVSGYNYKPYGGEKAILDLAFEIGDTITIGGLYSVLAYADTVYNSAALSAISAPELDEIDEEYPSAATKNSSIKRQLARTRSLITKTASEITLMVEDLDNEMGQTLRVAADGVTITNAAGDTLTIDGGQIDATTIRTQDLQLTGVITWGDLDSDTQGEINDAYSMASDASTTAGNAYDLASTAYSNADTVYSEFAQVKKTVGGVTYIDGSMIYSSSIYADALHLGGNLTVYSATYGNAVGGYLGYTTSLLDDSSGIHMACGSGEVAATANGAHLMYGSTSYQVYAGSGNCGIVSGGTYYYFFSGSAYPSTSDGTTVTLGTSSKPWGMLYASSCSCCTSDREKKNSIEYEIDGRYDTLWSLLRPCTGKFNDGTSDRTHMFLISQDVEQAIEAAELTSQDFAAFIKSRKEDGEGYDYALRYEEFIPLIIRQVQKLQARVAELEGALA